MIITISVTFFTHACRHGLWLVDWPCLGSLNASSEASREESVATCHTAMQHIDSVVTIESGETQLR